VSAIQYMCTKFGVDSSSCFSFRVRRHTHIVTDATDHLIPCIGYCQRGIIIMVINWLLSESCSSINKKHFLFLSNGR